MIFDYDNLDDKYFEELIRFFEKLLESYPNLVSKTFWKVLINDFCSLSALFNFEVEKFENDFKRYLAYIKKRKEINKKYE